MFDWKRYVEFKGDESPRITDALDKLCTKSPHFIKKLKDSRSPEILASYSKLVGKDFTESELPKLKIFETQEQNSKFHVEEREISINFSQITEWNIVDDDGKLRELGDEEVVAHEIMHSTHPTLYKFKDLDRYLEEKGLNERFNNNPAAQTLGKNNLANFKLNVLEQYAIAHTNDVRKDLGTPLRKSYAAVEAGNQLEAQALLSYPVSHTAKSMKDYTMKEMAELLVPSKEEIAKQQAIEATSVLNNKGSFTKGVGVNNFTTPVIDTNITKETTPYKRQP